MTIIELVPEASQYCGTVKYHSKQAMAELSLQIQDIWSHVLQLTMKLSKGITEYLITSTIDPKRDLVIFALSCDVDNAPQAKEPAHDTSHWFVISRRRLSKLRLVIHLWYRRKVPQYVHRPH